MHVGRKISEKLINVLHVYSVPQSKCLVSKCKQEKFSKIDKRAACFNTIENLLKISLLIFRTTNATSNEDSSSGETPLIINEGVPAQKSGSSKSSTASGNVSRQHQVLWNLFAHNLDSVIMSLIESEHFKMW